MRATQLRLVSTDQWEFAAKRFFGWRRRFYELRLKLSIEPGDVRLLILVSLPIRVDWFAGEFDRGGRLSARRGPIVEPQNNQ